METRILPPDEYWRLEGTELGQVSTELPHGTNVIVVEDGDKIVGTWAAIPYMHAEGIWVDPEYRGKFAVPKRLIRGMARVANRVGVQVAFTTALTPEVERLVEHMKGVQLPGKHFVIKVA